MGERRGRDNERIMNKELMGTDNNVVTAGCGGVGGGGHGYEGDKRYWKKYNKKQTVKNNKINK